MNLFGRNVPIILQSEAPECGIACLAMIAGHHGIETDLQTMRREHAVSLKGSTLKSLIDIADSMNLAARPLRVELPALRQLRLPAILHVDFNHFVVLTAVHADRVELHEALAWRCVAPDPSRSPRNRKVLAMPQRPVAARRDRVSATCRARAQGRKRC